MHAIPMLDVNYKCNKCYIKFIQFIYKSFLSYLCPKPFDLPLNLQSECFHSYFKFSNLILLPSNINPFNNMLNNNFEGFSKIIGVIKRRFRDTDCFQKSTEYL